MGYVRKSVAAFEREEYENLEKRYREDAKRKNLSATKHVESMVKNSNNTSFVKFYNKKYGKNLVSLAQEKLLRKKAERTKK